MSSEFQLQIGLNGRLTFYFTSDLKRAVCWPSHSSRFIACLIVTETVTCPRFMLFFVFFHISHWSHIITKIDVPLHTTDNAMREIIKGTMVLAPVFNEADLFFGRSLQSILEEDRAWTSSSRGPSVFVAGMIIDLDFQWNIEEVNPAVQTRGESVDSVAIDQK